jgi:hypothetical protein
MKFLEATVTAPRPSPAGKRKLNIFRDVLLFLQ